MAPPRPQMAAAVGGSPTGPAAAEKSAFADIVSGGGVSRVGSLSCGQDGGPDTPHFYPTMEGGGTCDHVTTCDQQNNSNAIPHLVKVRGTCIKQLGKLRSPLAGIGVQKLPCSSN